MRIAVAFLMAAALGGCAGTHGAFELALIKVNVPVELTVSKESGITPHDFVIRAQEAGIVVDQDLATEPRKIAFTPKKVGKYTFYCGKKPPLMASHRERGMEGVLEVVP